MPTKYPAYDYWKYCSVPSSWGFSQEDVVNFWNATRGHLKVVLPLHESNGLAQALCRYLLKTIISEERHAHLCITSGKCFFLSASSIRGELIRKTGRRAQGCLAAAGYHPRHPDRYPRLTPDHRCHRSMLPHRHQDWNHWTLISCAICRWVHSRPLQLFWVCPGFRRAVDTLVDCWIQEIDGVRGEHDDQSGRG